MIELKNVKKSFGNKTILDEFSMKVCDGEYIAVTGQSGCGKSTLLNIIGLLENFDAGELNINGNINVSPSSSKACRIIRNEIGYLFQNFALVDDQTVEYNLNLAQKYVTRSKKDKRLDLEKVLDSVDLNNYEKCRIFELSGGEQQRVALARIMLKPCNIILADEPTGSLDAKNRDKVIDILENINTSGKTIIIVTHDGYVANRCQRTILL